MPLIVCDLDGTIALNDHRQHWLDKEKHLNLSEEERWDSFFRDCGDDAPNRPVIELLKRFDESDSIPISIVILSGRNDSARFVTEIWLQHFEVPFDNLIMRSNGDFRPDEVIKKEMYEDFCSSHGWTKKHTLFVLDDRQKVVDMWREMGLTCFQVAPGNF